MIDTSLREEEGHAVQETIHKHLKPSPDEKLHLQRGCRFWYVGVCVCVWVSVDVGTCPPFCAFVRGWVRRCAFGAHVAWSTRVEVDGSQLHDLTRA